MARRIRASVAAAIASLQLVSGSAGTAAASATQPSGAIKDCVDDQRIDGHYGRATLARALATLPNDIDEYTDCRAVLSHARRFGDDGRPASKGGRTSVIRDCATHGYLAHRYRLSKVRLALRTLPSDIDRYTSCRSYIKREVRLGTR